MTATYIDVTELLASGLHTGIQRVVRQIARGGMAVGAGRLIPVIAYGDRFHALNAAGTAALCGFAAPAAHARLTEGGRAMRMSKYALALVPPLYDWVQLRHFQRKLAGQLAGLFAPEPLIFQSRDRVVLLDSFWGGGTALQAARNARRVGCQVIAVIYDMIPVTHPKLADARLARAFSRAVLEAAEICSGFVTISHYCRDVILEFLEHRGFVQPVSVFYLGADLLHYNDHRSSVSTFPISLGEGGRLHLMVGTIEPRKGHAIVLEAFEQLWRQGLPHRLLIIGKVGWDVDDLMKRLATHSRLGRQLFMIHNASDAVLDLAFDLADAAIIASTVEGFGLPLVEALNRKLPVIASDIPVFREIAGDAALYFRLDADYDLARAVVEMDRRSSEFCSAASSFVWVDWSAAVGQFRDAIDAVTSAPACAAA